MSLSNVKTQSTENTVLSLQELQFLRLKNLITPAEYAFRLGDLLIAENVSSGVRRTLGNHCAVLSGVKRLLKD